MRLFVPFIVFLLVLGTGTSIVISPSKIVDYQDPPVIQTYTEGELYLVANSDLSSIEVTVLKTLQNIEYSIIRLDSSISTNVQLWPNIALQLDTGEIDTQLEDYHEQIGTEEVWSMNYTGDGIVIAVVDTGVNFNHPALQGKMVAEQSFHNETYGYQTSKGPADDNGHGTSVASLVAGHEPGRFQSAAYNASIVSAKLGVENGYITSLSLIGALDWVVSLDYVDIITMSLSEPEENYDIDPLEEMANLAASKGKFVFGSAGNRGSFGRDPYSMGSPGTAPEAISVGAVTDMGNLASFSSEGPSYGNHPKPDVLAPGVGIETAERLGGYRSRSGTSFSTPIAASVAAVVLQAANENGISLTPAGMKATLLGSSRDLGLPYYQQGFGLLNLTGAVIDLPNLSQESLVSPRGGTLPAIELPAETPVYLPLTVISDHQVIDISAASEGISISYDPIYLGNTSTFRLKIQSSILFADSVIDISIDLKDDQVTYSLPVEVLEKPEYTVLVDLKHTVLDNILAAPVNAPLERIGLRDLERYTNYIRDNN
ncbi:MAG: S8 family peptidase, partial [Candidatus Kariarchaeaceae archaeon]